MTASSTDRIEKQIDLQATPARVWRALSDYREFSQWFRIDLESPLVPGATTRGRITHPGYEHVVMDLVVKAMEPERYFAYAWHPNALEKGVDYSTEQPTLVEFRLEPIPTGTRLTIVESGFDALPPERRETAFRGNSRGWDGQMKNIAAHVGSAA